MLFLEKAVDQKDVRGCARVARKIPSYRRRLTAEFLFKAIRTLYKNSGDVQTRLAQWLGPVGSSEGELKDSEGAGVPSPEVEVLGHLLVVIWLIDNERHADAVTASTALLAHLETLNRRTMDGFGAQAYFYFARAHELSGTFGTIRSKLLALYKTSTLRHDTAGQAVLLNLILRNYLMDGQYDQADKVVSKTTFPEDASNSQQARNFYYVGRIKAIQLDYQNAYRCLVQAMRKAPTRTAKGFRLTVQKLTCVVQLLLGEVPVRTVFFSEFGAALQPYFFLAKAVRVGDLAAFHGVVSEYKANFLADGTLSLVQRLRTDVIKTGLRMINKSYSHISLEDVRAKLHLDSVDDAQSIVAKAIRDGVIRAVVSHETATVRSLENADVYSTEEPQGAFHKRINFCMQIYNESLKSMRFPETNSAESTAEWEKRSELFSRQFEEGIDEEDLEDDDAMDM